MNEWVDVNKGLPAPETVVFVKMSQSQDMPIKINSIKANAVYDHSEEKWIMYSEEKNDFVDICGTVIAWREDSFPMFSVKQS